MKYQVVYTKPKRKGYSSKQVATFLDIESAIFWETLMKKQGVKEIEIHMN